MSLFIRFLDVASRQAGTGKNFASRFRLCSCPPERFKYENASPFDLFLVCRAEDMSEKGHTILRYMKVAPLLVFLCVIAAALSGQTDRSAQGPKYPASSKQMVPAMILWNTGLVETITRASLGSRKTWRITHYPQDPTATKTNDYDLYDLDRRTLAPLRSMMNTEEYHLELTFAEKEATFRKITDRDT
jgi:hypothetical protein